MRSRPAVKSAPWPASPGGLSSARGEVSPPLARIVLIPLFMNEIAPQAGDRTPRRLTMAGAWQGLALLLLVTAATFAGTGWSDAHAGLRFNLLKIAKSTFAKKTARHPKPLIDEPLAVRARGDVDKMVELPGTGSSMRRYLNATPRTRRSAEALVLRTLKKSPPVAFHDLHGETLVTVVRLASGDKAAFRADYAGDTELAAFQVSRLLGLDFVPPAVRYQLGDRVGVLQLWVDGSEGKEFHFKRDLSHLPEHEQRISPTTGANARAFAFLIALGDRHGSNWKLAKDDSGELRLVTFDHAGSFLRGRPQSAWETEWETKNLAAITMIGRDFYAKLKSVSDAKLMAAARVVDKGNERFTTDPSMLPHRRQMLVDHIEKLIATHGADQVLR